MASEYSIGHPVDRPPQFRPTVAFTRGRYNYAIDRKVGVVRRTGPHGSAAPSRYFALKTTQIEPETKSRPKRRLWVIWARRVLITVIVAAIVLILMPFYPAVEFQAQQSFAKPLQVSTVPVTNNNELIIPAIGVQTPILEGPSLNILLKHEGVWHQAGDLPNGSLVLAGHRYRYLPPNTSTLYNLGKLKPGDAIIVDWYSHRYTYSIDSVTTISSTDNEVLKHRPANHVYVYTCQDWSMTKRYLVSASLVP